MGGEKEGGVTWRSGRTRGDVGARGIRKEGAKREEEGLTHIVACMGREGEGTEDCWYHVQ